MTKRKKRPYVSDELWAECQRYGLKSLQKSTLQDKDDLKDDMHKRPKHRQTQTTSSGSTHKPRQQLVQFSSLPRRKTTFCRNFTSKIWNCRKFSIYLHHRKTFTSTLIHTSTHTSSVFRDNEIFISKGRFNDDDRRRDTKDWNIPRHRHGHQP